MGIEQIYSSVFLYTVIAFTVITANCVSIKSYDQLKINSQNGIIAFVICIAFALFLGLRPTEGFLFGDSYLYKHTFNLIVSGIIGKYADGDEWIWLEFTRLCAATVPLSIYFTLIAIGYFGFSFWACYKLTPNNILVCYLFLLGSISMYTYGVNGLRNGLACSIVLVVLAYMCGPKRNLIIAAAFAFLALNIHKSTILPIASLIASIYIVKSFKAAYTWWIISIFISLIAGNLIVSVLMAVGYDDRMTSYLTSMDTDKFNRIGFRWDFLIYSAMPIILGYYIIIKKRIEDKPYTLLLNTYVLANAFWVLCIRASYSNRFAYLSWFMYPIVLAYPLLKLDIWGDKQGARVAQIMLAHIGFTWFMQTFYW